MVGKESMNIVDMNSFNSLLGNQHLKVFKIYRSFFVNIFKMVMVYLFESRLITRFALFWMAASDIKVFSNSLTTVCRLHIKPYTIKKKLKIQIEHSIL